MGHIKQILMSMIQYLIAGNETNFDSFGVEHIPKRNIHQL